MHLDQFYSLFEEMLNWLGHHGNLESTKNQNSDSTNGNLIFLCLLCRWIFFDGHLQSNDIGPNTLDTNSLMTIVALTSFSSMI